MTKIYSLDKLDPVEREAVRGSTAQAGIYVTPMLMRRFKGDGNTAIIFKRLLYCSEQWADEEGWFFQTAGTIEKVIGLGNRALQRSIGRLEKMGLIEKRLKGALYKAHYRVDLSAYLELIKVESSLAPSDKTESSLAPSDEASLAPSDESNLVPNGKASLTTSGKEVIPTSELINDTKSDTYPSSSGKTVQTLADLLDEIGPLGTPKEIDTELRDAGYDPDEVGARIKAAADQAIVEAIIEQTETHPGPEDLARVTEEKQAEAGGNYADPAQAGGDDDAAFHVYTLFCEMQGEMPTKKELQGMILELSETLKPLSPSPDEIEAAFQIMAQDFKYRVGNYNVFQDSFKADLATCLRRARAKGTQHAAPCHQPESALLSQDALRERQATRPAPPQDDDVGMIIKNELTLQMGRNEFQQYVSPCRFTCDDGALVIIAPDIFTRDWLENRLGKTIKRVLAGVTDGSGEVILKYLGKSDLR